MRRSCSAACAPDGAPQPAPAAGVARAAALHGTRGLQRFPSGLCGAGARAQAPAWRGPALFLRRSSAPLGKPAYHLMVSGMHHCIGQRNTSGADQTLPYVHLLEVCHLHAMPCRKIRHCPCNFAEVGAGKSPASPASGGAGRQQPAGRCALRLPGRSSGARRRTRHAPAAAPGAPRPHARWRAWLQHGSTPRARRSTRRRGPAQ